MSNENVPAGTGHDVDTVDRVGDPIPDPGLHEHQPRPTDVDERAERRAERQIAGLFGLSAVFTVLFVVVLLRLPHRRRAHHHRRVRRLQRRPGR